MKKLRSIKSRLRKPRRSPSPRLLPISSQSITETADQTTVPCSPSTSNQDANNLPLPTLQKRLWNEAYDQVKENEPKVVDRFEELVSAELRRNKAESSAPESTENEIKDTWETRSLQMQQLVRDGLDRTRKEASIKQEVNDGLQIVQTVRGVIDKAVNAAPEAAVAWAGICLGLEVF